RQFTKDDRRKVIIVPNVENSMKLLQPLFSGLQQRTADLIASFTKTEIQAIERYFVEATVIMKETTDNMNTKQNDKNGKYDNQLPDKSGDMAMYHNTHLLFNERGTNF